MFDIGFWEVCIISVVGLLVIGPERLPDVARTLGKYIGKMQRTVAGIKSDFQRELDGGELHQLLGEQKKQIEELQSIVNEAGLDTESSTRDAIQAAISEYTPPDTSSFDAADEAEASGGLFPSSQLSVITAQVEDAKKREKPSEISAKVAQEEDESTTKSP